LLARLSTFAGDCAAAATAAISITKISLNPNYAIAEIEQSWGRISNA
jgi:hypothetical protein